jgi:hypothetical protein
MKKNAQAGFSALDTVLAIVLVAAIAAAGYFGYQNMHKTSQTATTSSVSPKPRTPAPSPTPTVEKGGVLTISQFGVKLTLANGLSGLGYVYSAATTAKDATGKPYTNPAHVNLISAQLKGQQSVCADAQGKPRMAPR